jgi:g-D-glutamyl-meso-diaminopimelate peptidase
MYDDNVRSVEDQGECGGYTYNRLVADIERLLYMYPCLHMESIGQSVLGKPIPAVSLGTGQIIIHYHAACHANEWITSPLLMRFIEEAACAFTMGSFLRGRDMRSLFAETSLWIVPMVNPDGADLVQNGVTASHPFYKELLAWNKGCLDFRNWKANIRGVDLNDQFPAHWEEEKIRRGIKEPGERDYGGITPLSEPESRAIAQFTCLLDPQLVLSLHTQGREIYWNYRDLEPSHAAAAAARLAQISGYQAVKLSGSDAGFKDWFIQEFGRLGFTIEVGLGTNPLPETMLPQMYEEVIEILLEALEIGNSERRA